MERNGGEEASHLRNELIKVCWILTDGKVGRAVGDLCRQPTIFVFDPQIISISSRKDLMNRANKLFVSPRSQYSAQCAQYKIK
jgi:hypothetical protein